MNQNDKIIVAVVAVVFLIVGAGIGFIAPGLFASSSSSQGTQQPYSVTLVVTINNVYSSSVGAQPAYFVLEQIGTLGSASHITFPANRQIELTIVNYDDGNDSVNAIYTQVKGTQSGHILVASNNLMNATQSSQGISLIGAENVTSLPSDLMSHTFTILDASSNMLVNIPVAPSAVVQSFLYFKSTGTYTWQCEVPCGSGVTGWSGAMDSAGWMTGSLTIS